MDTREGRVTVNGGGAGTGGLRLAPKREAREEAGADLVAAFCTTAAAGGGGTFSVQGGPLDAGDNAVDDVERTKLC